MIDMQAPAAGGPPPAGSDAPKVEPLDDKALVKEATDFLQQKRDERRPYEAEWYNNAATLRAKGGNPTWASLVQQFQIDRTPPHRKYMSVNIVWTKFAAKLAKQLNSRPRPQIIPNSRDRDDVLDARFTLSAMNYLHRKTSMEEKYELANAQAEITGKSFFWLYWNPSQMGVLKDPRNGEKFEAPIGDVQIEVGSAFELLVDDLGQPKLGKQKKIMRVSPMLIRDALAAYPRLNPELMKSDVNEADLFQFERQIADLGAKWQIGTSSSVVQGGTKAARDNGHEFVLRIELFEAPSQTYPKGRYRIVISQQLATYQEELPYGFSNVPDNPYPVEELSSDLAPFQFWPQTQTERLRPIQNQIDTIMSKIQEDLDLSLHPKWLIPRAARIPKNAFNSEGGEKIYYNYFPGMPPPQMLQPRGVSQDAWRMLERLVKFADEITGIWPSSIGGSDPTAESGVQTNLIQEAADRLYGPHRRRNERSLENLWFKARRLMAKGYDIPRLVSVTSKSNIPSVFAFKGAQIDEHAEIVVQIGSALPDAKSARLQAVMELAGSGLLGDQNAPSTRRAAMSLVDLGGVEEDIDPTYPDYERARNENWLVTQGQQLEMPAPWHTDAIHVEVHFELMNSPEWDTLTPEQKQTFLTHVALHLRKHNPILGFEIAQMIPDAMIGDTPLVVILQQAAYPPVQPGQQVSPDPAQPGPSQLPAPPAPAQAA